MCIAELALFHVLRKVHAESVTQRNDFGQAKTIRRVTDGPQTRRYACYMAKQKIREPRQFIRNWRKFRGLTQEQLAERMGVARSYISHVEKGKRRYDQMFLEAAAEALVCTPADLIMRDPLQPESIWSIWDQIEPVDRQKASKVLEAFIKKTGTSN